MNKTKLVSEWVRTQCEIDCRAVYSSRALYERFCLDCGLPAWPGVGSISLNLFSMAVSVSHPDIERRRSTFIGLRPKSMVAL
jgi:hypothetical protein